LAVVQDAVFLPDGTLCVASVSGIYVHDAQTLAGDGRKPLATGWVTHLAFTPDGGHLIAASETGEIVDWMVAKK